ncbi:MAG: amidohydrolase [Woeseiaceae bacterium]|nr:amidohydrolase [Woeseiaceae bacterium]
MPNLKVSIVQSALHWHDPERNLAGFTKLIAQENAGTDLIVLPEMFTTGFTMHARDYAERMDGRTLSWMAREAENSDAALCGSLIIEDDGHYYNRFVLMHPDGNFEHYDKRHCFRLAGEHEHYAPGSRLATMTLNGWRIRPMICYDLRFPVWSRNHDDYDLLIYTANWPARRHLAWETLIRARAIENLAYVAAVNRIGTDGNDIPYDGGSSVIDFLGNYVVAPSGDAGVSTATLDKSELDAFRDRFPFHLDADPFRLDDPDAERSRTGSG